VVYRSAVEGHRRCGDIFYRPYNHISHENAALSIKKYNNYNKYNNRTKNRNISIGNLVNIGIILKRQPVP
jgi:hypothetical protein